LHFQAPLASRRYGLFVIIALGETLIVAAARVSGASWTGSLLSVAVLAVAVTCGLCGLEHWNNAEPVPPEAEWVNSGKF
jgi:low temperature requirement protein LtrA